MMSFIKTKESELGSTQTIVKFSHGDFSITAYADGIVFKGEMKIQDKEEMATLAKTIGEASQEWINLRNCIRNKLSV